ncbi:site-specific integrase [Priestia aryabhattai]|uniref:site-specific integrase n=1 Tax=Priestia megaterium TaxID=1404 RepID=UPI003F9B875E
MELRIKVGSSNKSTAIEKKKNVEWETFRLDEYKQMFHQLVEGGYVLNQYEDVHWEVPDEVLDYPIILTFDVEMHSKLNTALKAYIILRLISGRSPLTVYNELAILKKIIIETDGFENSRAFEAILEIQTNKYSHRGYRTATAVSSFLSFYKIENYEEIINICQKIPSYKSTSRELPVFEDIMIFDDIVNNYFRKYPSDDTIKFLPIMLWWLLTNILPMRPSEFLLLKNDCLKFTDSQLSPYKISVPRIKNKSNSPGFVVHYDLIEIDKNTYNFLYESIKKIELLGINGPFLFSSELLTMFNKNKAKKKNKRMNRRDFDYLKKKFYEEVVENIYGQYNIERIRSGDTRHFAIINMCLQGFNMLSIARMAGQEDLKSQYSYFSHAEHFAQSYVYRLAQKKVENKIRNNLGDGIIGWRRYIYDRGKAKTHHNIEDLVGRVQYGDCTEQKDVFPDTCIEHCKFCPNYRFNPSVNENQEAIEWLADSSEILEAKIKESIELMKGLSSTIADFLRNTTNDSLKSTSRNLLSYMDMKATIDAQLMEVNFFGRKRDE